MKVCRYNKSMDRTDKEVFELAEQTFEFLDKLEREADSKGNYVCKDPHEKIIPIDGLVIKCGKRKMVQLKSDIKILSMGVSEDFTKKILSGEIKAVDVSDKFKKSDKFSYFEIL